MDGEIDELVEALRLARKAEQLEELELATVGGARA
jgi:hypothetical protein